MDGTRFDAVTRGLAAGTSRRRVLGGLLGGIVAVQSGGSAFAVKRGKRRNRGGAATDTYPLAPGTLAGGVFENSIEVCHFDPETGGYEILTVSPISIPDYLSLGDTLYLDCCVDAECGSLPCFTASGCIEGACAYDATPGATCALTDGTTGACDADGVCVFVAAVVPPPIG